MGGGGQSAAACSLFNSLFPPLTLFLFIYGGELFRPCDVEYVFALARFFSSTNALRVRQVRAGRVRRVEEPPCFGPSL